MDMAGTGGETIKQPLTHIYTHKGTHKHAHTKILRHENKNGNKQNCLYSHTFMPINEHRRVWKYTYGETLLRSYMLSL